MTTGFELGVERLRNRGVIFHSVSRVLVTGWPKNHSDVPALTWVRQMIGRLGVAPADIDHDNAIVRQLRSPHPHWLDLVRRCSPLCAPVIASSPSATAPSPASTR